MSTSGQNPYQAPTVTAAFTVDEEEPGRLTGFRRSLVLFGKPACIVLAVVYCLLGLGSFAGGAMMVLGATMSSSTAGRGRVSIVFMLIILAAQGLASLVASASFAYLSRQRWTWIGEGARPPKKQPV